MLGPVPYWFLGCVALAVVWGAAGLCALASLSYARALGKRAAALEDKLREGTVSSGLGEGGALAMHTIDQIGRAMDGEPPAIVFSDKTYRAEVFGGTITVVGGDGAAAAAAGTVDIAAQGSLEVWPDLETQLEAAKVHGDDELDALYKDARSSKGAPREVRVPFVAGKKVYFATSDDGALTFLSAEDPRPFFATRQRAHVLFAVTELAICAGLTAVALRAPIFHGLSTLGGVALLAFFLIVQPVGVSVEEASREPFRRFLRGVQKRSAPFPGGVVPGRTTTQVTQVQSG